MIPKNIPRRIVGIVKLIFWFWLRFDLAVVFEVVEDIFREETKEKLTEMPELIDKNSILGAGGKDENSMPVKHL